MKSFQMYVRSDGTPSSVELFEQSAWRILLGPLMYWLDLHKPRWMEPGEGRPTTVSHGDGTCTLLWRLRLDLWLGFDFHHTDRKLIQRIDLPAPTFEETP